MVAERVARAAERPDAALHQRRDGPVQGRVHRPREARLQARHLARRSACAPAASTTTSRTSAAPRATTPSSRCSATSPSATTSRRTRSPSPGSCSTKDVRHRREPAGHRLRRRRTSSARRRGARALEEGRRRLRRPHHRPRRQGQLLGDGRHRPLRPVLARSTTCRATTSPAPIDGRRRLPGPAPATATAGWRSGTWSSCSSSGRRRAPLARCRSRRSTPAPASSACAPCVQGVRSNYDTDLLRPLIDRARELSAKKYVPPTTTGDDDVSHARHRRPRARDGVPHRRRRAAPTRRARLRAAPHHAARRSATAWRSGSTEPFLADAVRAR